MYWHPRFFIDTDHSEEVILLAEKESYFIKKEVFHLIEKAHSNRIDVFNLLATMPLEESMGYLQWINQLKELNILTSNDTSKEDYLIPTHASVDSNSEIIFLNPILIFKIIPDVKS